MTLGETIGGLIRTNASNNQSLTEEGGSSSWFQMFSGSVQLHGSVRTNNRVLDSTDVIILNHPVYGFLGLKLADSEFSPFSTPTVSRVINKNNTFIDVFSNTLDVDTAITTSNVNVSNQTMSFDADEVFQTLVIAKNNVAYSQTLTSIEGSLPNVALTVSFDGGSNFINSTVGTTLNVSNTSTNGIILKMVATSSASETTDVVSRITCNYS